MTKSLVIHAGFLKTGTTSLQASLHEHAVDLLKEKVFYPRVINPHLAVEADHHFAAIALIGKTEGWQDEDRSLPSEPIESWLTLANAYRKFNGTSIFSSEMLSELTIPNIQRIQSDTGNIPTKVIFSIRGLVKMLPSAYQQKIKFGLIKVSYEQWLEHVFTEGSAASDQFWLRHNHPEVLKRWAGVFGNKNIHLIVADEHRPEFLFRTFEEISGIRTELKIPERLGKNRSLSIEEMSLMRAINRRFRKARDWDDYRIFIRESAAKGLTDRPEFREGHHKLKTPIWAVEKASDLAHSYVREIQALDINVYGNLNSLTSQDVEIGSNEFVESIDIKTVAAMFFEFERSKIVRNLPTQLLLNELIQRIKNRFNPGLRFMRKR